MVASRDGRVELWWVGLDGELGGGANKVEGQCQELEGHYRYMCIVQILCRSSCCSFAKSLVLYHVSTPPKS